MYSCPYDAIPREYRKIAEGLFPPEGFLEGQGPTAEAAIAFAEILGIGSDYKKLLTSSKSGGDSQRGYVPESDTSKEQPNHDRPAAGLVDLHVFLGHFQNNLDLLIQKTWVEKADETRKDKLLDRIPAFISDIERGEYQKALGDFGTILEELAYLFFGVQSHKDDFIEYVLRIDTQMGLFWWYGGLIGSLQKIKSDSKLAENVCFKAVLLIGLCYLTNF
jgi:hypothetical protein